MLAGGWLSARRSARGVTAQDGIFPSQGRRLWPFFLLARGLRDGKHTHMEMHWCLSYGYARLYPD